MGIVFLSPSVAALSPQGNFFPLLPLGLRFPQSHKGAAACRNKSFPHYEDLCIVYAKYHATGKDAQAPADVVEELEAEKNDDKLDDIPEDVDCTQVPTPGSNGEEQNAQKKKRRIQ
ncbi:hypothetical protein CMV_013430 [Castanea mollissima]|uniref:Uncharacterized protein n=1 Tax=Castanea mollissima TaxID=60419 RepID=A0A8J4RDU2_9ROSI|nr:hypothetical protein CMV_013430 [Castanea mollissima]